MLMRANILARNSDHSPNFELMRAQWNLGTTLTTERQPFKFAGPVWKRSHALVFAVLPPPHRPAPIHRT